MRIRRFGTTTAVITAAFALLAAGCGSTEQKTTAAESATGEPGRTASPSQGSGATKAASAPVPDELKFTTTTLDGKKFQGSSLAGKDAVLWFWAPWCHVCRSEAPTIAKAADKWKGKVTFVGIPGKSRTADMKQFVADTGLDGIQHAVDTDGSLWSRFGVPAQPAVALVNDDGTVKVGLGPVGATQFGDEIERLTLK
ncbi:TlpA family protein disulfide reductase [Streptomyces alboflavus]|uniref:TlpA family protein disulfide reductase n=1 Tax=Streptomyces alboflavus TaxID=67267 RepID=UPI0004BEEE37|nr:redoxin family protein [Streptomyces alboflavus]